MHKTAKTVQAHLHVKAPVSLETVHSCMPRAAITPGVSTAAPCAESGLGIPIQHRPTGVGIDQFQQLDQPGQAAAVRSLAANGYGDHEIARITRLHVEQVRRLLNVQQEQR